MKSSKSNSKLLNSPEMEKNGTVKILKKCNIIYNNKEIKTT